MARQKKEDRPAPGCPAWLATYGDMVTLVLTFFVLLFSFSTIDAQKWEAIAASFASAFSGSPAIWEGHDLGVQQPGQGQPVLPSDFEGDIIEDSDEWEQLVQKILGYVEENKLGGDVVVENNEYEIIVRVRGDILFDLGKAVLKDDAKELIVDFFRERVIPDLDKFSTIRIEGHTDNLPIRTAEFADNVQLSQRRSWAVRDYIINAYPRIDTDFPVIDPGMIDCNGRGEYHPVDSNDTPEGRARNRRVDFVLVRKLTDAAGYIP